MQSMGVVSKVTQPTPWCADRNQAQSPKKTQGRGTDTKWGKCEFAKDSMMFLGHCVTVDGVTPAPGKIKAIKEMPAPTDIEGVSDGNGQIPQ